MKKNAHTTRPNKRHTKKILTMLKYQNPSFEEALAGEWIVANGLGGYASSSICGANTRRYHGLFVPALTPPTGRMVMVSKIEEEIRLNGKIEAPLSSNRFPGAVHPQGYHYLHSFERRPLPAATFEVAGCCIRKTVFMPHGSNTSVVEYENTGRHAYQLKLLPLFVHRDYHSLFREDPYYDYYLQQRPGLLKIHAHYGAPALFVAYSKGAFNPNRQWFRDFEYDKEKNRGLDFREDGRSLGDIVAVLAPGEKLYLVFTLDKAMSSEDPARLKVTEIERLRALEPEAKDLFFRDLAVAADQFIVRRQSSDAYTVIAGYHWFTDWGRDTMIAMRGLCLALGKDEVARSIVRTFLQYLDRGMLPNRFPDQGEQPEYNTIDATLWLFVTLYEYYQGFEDKAFIDEVFDSLTVILRAHLEGTRYSIHVMEEGLLFGGEGIAQLTWMDARIGDYVVTPRHGCPVEVNVLWYNALKIYAYFADLLDRADTLTPEPTRRFEASFRKYFWNAAGYLNDVVIPGGYTDAAVRPNQLYALSLPYGLLSPKEARQVLDTVRRHLLTPLGLRSLTPEDAAFQPLYGGDQWRRDTAYHQGTVWAFLLGEYALAYLKVNKGSAKARREIREVLRPLERHFYEKDGIHCISEIFDGGAPDAGRGAVQQAWSIGMLLKVFADYLSPTRLGDQKARHEVSDLA
jgi:predicted glycogen debranching enzyme